MDPSAVLGVTEEVLSVLNLPAPTLPANVVNVPNMEGLRGEKG